MWDVIVVGARCSGSALALLLAREGMRVLVLDRARFPSAVISTHLILVPGVAALQRWELLDSVLAAGAATPRRSRTTSPLGVLEGPWPSVEGIDFAINLRRDKLDSLLAASASAAGADVREETSVVDLIIRDDRVVGVQTSSGLREFGRMIVGADGRRSIVARRVRASEYHVIESLTASFYTYVEDPTADPNTADLWTNRGLELLLVPTDNGLTIANVVVPSSRRGAFRSEREREFYAAFDTLSPAGERLRGATRVAPIYAGLDLRNFFRWPRGKGWALVGDAGHAKDPIRAQGMAEAFLDAEALAGGLLAGLDAGGDVDSELKTWHRERDRRLKVTYEVCIAACRLAPDLSPKAAALHELLRTRTDLLVAARALVAGVGPPWGFEHSHYPTLPRGEEVD